MRKGAGGAVALFIGVCLLSGCGNVRLHDETRAKLAAETKDQYTKADIPGILNVEAKNLDLLLAESIKVSRENHKLQVEFALLSIAADQKPMADTLAEASGQLKAIGLDASKGVEGVYAYLDRLIERRRALIAMEDQAGPIRRLVRVQPPECDGKLPTLEAWGKAEKLDEATLKALAATSLYANYSNACQKFIAEFPPVTGKLEQIASKIDQERLQLKRAEERTREEKQRLQTARTAYQTAADAGAASLARCAEREKALAEGAKTNLDKLQSALRTADKLDLSIANDERIKNLLVLLEAAADGKVDVTDPDLKKAARVAQELPSLWADMCEVLAISKPPPVGNLLLALRHATLLSEYAKEQQALVRSRIALLEERQTTLRNEAAQWVAVSHAICRFALLSASVKDTGGLCGRFSAKKEGKECSLGPNPFTTDCVTGRSWARNFQSSPEGPAKRELYKAMLAYQRAFAFQSRASEIDFQLVDVLHRETLARKRFAVQDWDALVGGAVAQLDAYYASGLKPAEIADLIVKAVGFTAVAIGAAQ